MKKKIVAVFISLSISIVASNNAFASDLDAFGNWEQELNQEIGNIEITSGEIYDQVVSVVPEAILTASFSELRVDYSAAYKDDNDMLEYFIPDSLFLMASTGFEKEYEKISFSYVASGISVSLTIDDFEDSGKFTPSWSALYTSDDHKDICRYITNDYQDIFGGYEGTEVADDPYTLDNLWITESFGRHSTGHMGKDIDLNPMMYVVVNYEEMNTIECGSFEWSKMTQAILNFENISKHFPGHLSFDRFFVGYNEKGGDVLYDITFVKERGQWSISKVNAQDNDFTKGIEAALK